MPPPNIDIDKTILHIIFPGTIITDIYAESLLGKRNYAALQLCNH